MFPREAPQLRSDPVARIGSHRPDLYREGRQQRHWIDLNQDLSKFWRRDERAESEWDLDSRNVELMESFQRPPRSVPDDALTIKSTSSDNQSVSS